MPPWIHMGRAQSEPRMVVLIRGSISDFRLGMREAAQRHGRAASHGGLLPGSPLARHWVKAPAMPWEGISVRGTHDPEVRAGGTGTPVLSPTRARGGSGDNAPRPPQAGLLPKP